jgi:ribosomal protein L23
MINNKRIIIGQIVTEKSEQLKTQANPVYTLKVHPKATKIDVKNELKQRYDLDPLSVCMTKIVKKTRIAGRGKEINKRAAGKKAIITLKSGQKLDLTVAKKR